MKNSINGYKFSFGKKQIQGTPKFTSIDMSSPDNDKKQKQQSNLRNITYLSANNQSKGNKKSSKSEHKTKKTSHLQKAISGQQLKVAMKINMNFTLTDFHVNSDESFKNQSQQFKGPCNNNSHKQKMEKIGKIIHKRASKNKKSPKKLQSAPSTPSHKNPTSDVNQKSTIEVQQDKSPHANKNIGPNKKQIKKSSFGRLFVNKSEAQLSKNKNTNNEGTYLQIYRSKKQKKYYSQSFFGTETKRIQRSITRNQSEKISIPRKNFTFSKKQLKDNDSISQDKNIQIKSKLPQTTKSINFLNDFHQSKALLNFKNFGSTRNNRLPSKTGLPETPKLENAVTFRSKPKLLSTKTPNLKERIQKLRIKIEP